MGTYMELVDRELIGMQKKLLVDTVRGVLLANIEYKYMANGYGKKVCPRNQNPPGPGLTIQSQGLIGLKKTT